MAPWLRALSSEFSPQHPCWVVYNHLYLRELDSSGVLGQSERDGCMHSCVHDTSPPHTHVYTHMKNRDKYINEWVLKSRKCCKRPSFDLSLQTLQVMLNTTEFGGICFFFSLLNDVLVSRKPAEGVKSEHSFLKHVFLRESTYLPLTCLKSRLSNQSQSPNIKFPVGIPYGTVRA